MNMKVRSIWFSGCIFLSTTLTFGKEYKLWYNAPATVWEEALPIGNGRIGAMVYGNPLQEVYQLNEESIWSGYPQDWNNPKAANALPQVGKLSTAETMPRQANSGKPMHKVRIQPVTCLWQT